MNKFLETYFSFIKKTLPSQPEDPCVGLDIGATSCRVVEMILSPSLPKVKSWGIVPIENNNTLDAIKKLFSTAKIQTTRVYTALSGQGTLIRFIKMPRMPLDQLKDSLLLESDKYFPFSKDQIYMDCHILNEKNKKEGKMDVLVAVAKRDMVKQRLDLLRELGFQQNFIGINAVVLANAFDRLKVSSYERNQEEKKNLQLGTAIIDIGEVKTSLVILIEGRPRFNRDISFGGRDFTQKISSVMGLGLNEAEQIKKNPKQRFSDMQSVILPVLSGLVSEIRLSFDYFRSENQQDVKEIYIMGSSAKIPGIFDFLNKELEINAKPWQPLEAIELSSNVVSSDFSDHVGEMGVAMGLSLDTYDEY